jgi:hypothetical protein
MTRRRRPSLIVFSALVLVLVVGPAQAQEADTTATTPSAEAAAADTAVAGEGEPPDTLTTDAPSPDTATADSGRAVQPDTAVAAESASADSALGSAEADSLAAAKRRARAADRAQSTAASWLALIDAGKFGESWDAAAPTLREGITREQWRRRGTRVRSRLDTLKARELMRTQYRDSTRQIPGGQPVVALQYETEYDAQTVLEAVVTTRREGDWGVVGYRVVPRPATAPAPGADTTQAADTTQEGDSTQVRPDSLQGPDSTQVQPRPDSLLRGPDSTRARPRPDSAQTVVAPDSAQALPADSTQGASP